MPILRIQVRCNAATGLWVADCPQLVGVHASAETIKDVIDSVYSLIPPEWSLPSPGVEGRARRELTQARR